MSEHRHGRRLLVHLFLGVIALGSRARNLWNAANATKDHAIALPIDAHVRSAVDDGDTSGSSCSTSFQHGLWESGTHGRTDRIVPMMVAWTVLHSVFSCSSRPKFRLGHPQRRGFWSHP